MTNIFDTIEVDSPHYTEPRHILSGTLNLSGSEIPFYQAVMPLRAVVDELDLVEALPSDLRANWRLEELFQREIDWERVTDQLVKGYLELPNKLKFFSTLTVALLPLNSEGRLDCEYGDPASLPTPLPGAQNPSVQVRQIGSVQLITNATGQGILRWDPKRVFAATIDGQHRLAALKTLYRKGNLPSKSLESRVSVMFLILDPRAGFMLASGQISNGENQILTVVREIFIDLNMHSRTVARARQILLSDQDIEAKCLREVIATKVGVREEGRLPLGLIHWQHNESAKFNVSSQTAPFITTVELLYAVIKDILDISRPKDPLDAIQVRKFVQTINNAIGLDEFLKENQAVYHLKPLTAYVEATHLKENFETAFPNPSPPYIRAIADKFAQFWRPIILDVLTKFSPYANFIAEVDARGGIVGDIAHYLVQPVEVQKAVHSTWGAEANIKIDAPLAELHQMKAEDWAFYAVFQKALFRATKISFQQYAVIPGYTQQSFSDAWLSFLNEMAKRGLFKTKAKIEQGGAPVWAGIGLTPLGHTITWSEAAVQRIASLIVLWWYFYENELSSTKTYLKKAAGAQGAEKFPVAKSLLGSLTKGIDAIFRGLDPEITPAKLKAKTDDRLQDLIALARSSTATDAKDVEIASLSDEPGPDIPSPDDQTDQSETLLLNDED